ncbi:hypothetical protein [Solirubrum puertoriconensis]|uniref:Outer membrane protein beta-barrel domain-containing protein n=1 Tax=Solirubrum puertoriconensis TaxID=1751427 RepID=A0A9X0L4L1_SOLP1|nr:hypothetical protein [Solirubrum puertoriconensis]KUG07673.1 hypothetical protein ASU33_15225 [Solirubrum puertoriconensis]
MKHPFALLLTGLLASAALPAAAQRQLLSTDVAADTVRQRYGPNRQLFRHLYVGYALVLGQPERSGAELRSGASAELTLGLRQKHRLAEHLALGFDVRYARLQYSLAQNDAKVLPTPAQHYRESLVLQRADLEAWLRLNVGRRGNIVGRYFDVGGWGGRVIGTAHRTEDKPNSGAARRVNVVEHGLPYLQKWSYGLVGRVGANRYAAVVRYRLADTFRGERAALYPELPPWQLGLEIGLF